MGRWRTARLPGCLRFYDGFTMRSLHVLGHLGLIDFFFWKLRVLDAPEENALVHWQWPWRHKMSRFVRDEQKRLCARYEPVVTRYEYRD